MIVGDISKGKFFLYDLSGVLNDQKNFTIKDAEGA